MELEKEKVNYISKKINIKIFNFLFTFTGEKKKKGAPRGSTKSARSTKFNFHLPSPRSAIRSVLSPKAIKLRNQMDDENWGNEVPKTPKERTPRCISAKTIIKRSNPPKKPTHTPVVRASTANPRDNHLESLKERLNRLKAEDDERKKRKSLTLEE